MSEWINVKDKLPEKNKEVLAYRPTLWEPYNEIHITTFCWMCNDDPIWSDEVADYTHWMPLPQPPKE